MKAILFLPLDFFDAFITLQHCYPSLHLGVFKFSNWLSKNIGLTRHFKKRKKKLMSFFLNQQKPDHDTMFKIVKMISPIKVYCNQASRPVALPCQLKYRNIKQISGKTFKRK